MAGGFRRCPDEAAVGMAVRTGWVSRTECGADMTAFTGDIRMGAIKNEAGAEMIERFLC